MEEDVVRINCAHCACFDHFTLDRGNHIEKPYGDFVNPDFLICILIIVHYLIAYSHGEHPITYL